MPTVLLEKIDDAPAAVQPRGRFAQGVERTFGVDVEGLLVQLVAVLGQRQHLEHTCVVDQHIDLAQLRLGFIEQALYVVSAAHVCLHGQSLHGRLRAIGRPVAWLRQHCWRS
jgi:hypothetical protein